ncbi:hypothetical protein NP493_53g15011 [Ridgeia piscesae]|uniref:Uncharacterized protein n=1 Tax=Ridgeia piscesae TaxID=27915 RepID=A0AAD9PAX5_RIDPI|nr:hypothetical protein NP493_53g15011 [Ridgeia piscesae]
MNPWLQVDVLVNTPSGNGDHLTQCGVVSKAFYNAGGDNLQQCSEAVNMMLTCRWFVSQCSEAVNMMLTCRWFGASESSEYDVDLSLVCEPVQ